MNDDVAPFTNRGLLPSQVMILRLEGGFLFAGALTAYAATHSNWGLFLLLFLAPDVSMLGYAKDTRVGAACYNFAHTSILPISLLIASHFFGWPVILAPALTWLAHIGFDRLLGYGLKSPQGFKITHLGVLPTGKK